MQHGEEMQAALETQRHTIKRDENVDKLKKLVVVQEIDRSVEQQRIRGVIKDYAKGKAMEVLLLCRALLGSTSESGRRAN